MLNIIRNVLRSMDLFSCLPTLRAKSQPETANSCGGVLSILVLILFGYLFISQFVDVTSWKKIQFVQTQTNDIQNSKPITDFMVGIGVEGFPIAMATRFVRFQFQQITMKGSNYVGSRSLLSEPCTLSHWSAITEDLQKSFQSFNLQDKMCLSMGQNIKIDQASLDQYTILSVAVNSCLKLDQNDQRIYQGCASLEQFNQGNQAWIKAKKYFTATAIFVNTAFKPSQQVPTIKYLDTVRTTFTVTRGTQSIVMLSPYTITTDVSILPFQSPVVEEGYKLQSQNSQNFESVIYFENINIFFIKSFKSISINRSIGKVDEILSYAGGLFGIIISFLSFFMLSFNQYRYELLVGEGAFNYSDDGAKFTQSDFNFLQYLRFCAYDWIKTLTCQQLNWRSCKQIQQTREEANNQLDVTLLFKKIQHFERVVDYLISDKQNISLYLTEPPSIDQVKRTRRIAQYYEKVIQGKSAQTVEDIEMMNNVFDFALGLNQEGKTELALTNTAIKRKIFEDPDKSRQNILDQILQNYKIDDQIEDVKFDQDDEKIEHQIAQAFFRMNQIARRKIQQKIPIKILHRLRRKYESKLSQQTMAINLQI